MGGGALSGWKNFKTTNPPPCNKMGYSAKCVAETIYGDIFLTRFCNKNNSWEIPVGIDINDVIIFYVLPKVPKVIK
jgi:hypothetical protein